MTIEETMVSYTTILLKKRMCGARKSYQAVSCWWPCNYSIFNISVQGLW